jgi:hypothetical protein
MALLTHTPKYLVLVCVFSSLHAAFYCILMQKIDFSHPLQAQPGIVLTKDARHAELKMKNIQDLILWITTSDVPNPPWVIVKVSNASSRSIALQYR